MFEELGRDIREEVVLTLFHAQLAPEARQELAAAADGRRRRQRRPPLRARVARGRRGDRRRGRRGAADRGDAARRRPSAAAEASVATAAKAAVRPSSEKLGRNDPCWCGSGKKFKKCHGA